MAQQQYKNHLRFYPAHHFIFYPLLTAMFVLAINGYRKLWDVKLLWAAVLVILFFLGWLSFMLRQHYAIINQNRTVRLEMRLRYYILAQKRFETVEEKITFGQIAALRFAADEELLQLIDKTLAENLSPDAIKKLITNWQADTFRV